jgi:NAD(P)-dependent dehydrogenase (short-subunit alcohol dehydrogenase family)
VPDRAIEHPSGSIVVTASTAGLRNDPFVPYSHAIAKAGVVNFMKQAAHDLARWHIRVNAIAPGPFKTNLGRSGQPPSGASQPGAAASPIDAQAEEPARRCRPFSYAAYSVSPMNAFHSPEYTPPSSTSSSCVPISATFP